VDALLARIDAAFADATRPPDDALLHPQCSDDNDIKSLYGVPHWRELTEAAIEYEYAALFFLSPAGFRHFLPAYMTYALRHPRSDQAVIGSTVFALRPADGDLRDFSLSKFTLFDAPQRAAVVAFLEVLATRDDPADTTVAEAMAYWRSVA
jgi:hypothetical protein